MNIVVNKKQFPLALKSIGTLLWVVSAPIDQTMCVDQQKNLSRVNSSSGISSSLKNIQIGLGNQGSGTRKSLFWIAPRHHLWLQPEITSKLPMIKGMGIGYRYFANEQFAGGFAYFRRNSQHQSNYGISDISIGLEYVNTYCQFTGSIYSKYFYQTQYTIYGDGGTKIRNFRLSNCYNTQEGWSVQFSPSYRFKLNSFSKISGFLFASGTRIKRFHENQLQDSRWVKDKGIGFKLHFPRFSSEVKFIWDEYKYDGVIIGVNVIFDLSKQDQSVNSVRESLRSIPQVYEHNYNGDCTCHTDISLPPQTADKTQGQSGSGATSGNNKIPTSPTQATNDGALKEKDLAKANQEKSPPSASKIPRIKKPQLSPLNKKSDRPNVTPPAINKGNIKHSSRDPNLGKTIIMNSRGQEERPEALLQFQTSGHKY